MEQNVTPMNVGMKYGVILGVIGIVIGLLFHYTGVNEATITNSSLSVVTWITPNVIIFIILYLALKFLRENNEGILSFGQGLSTSMFVGLFSGLIVAIFTYVFFTYIAPDFMEKAIEIAMEEQDLSEEELEASQGFMKAFTSPIFASFWAFISRIFAVLILGSIASAMLKKE